MSAGTRKGVDKSKNYKHIKFPFSLKTHNTSKEITIYMKKWCWIEKQVSHISLNYANNRRTMTRTRKRMNTGYTYTHDHDTSGLWLQKMFNITNDTKYTSINSSYNNVCILHMEWAILKKILKFKRRGRRSSSLASISILLYYVT